MNTRNTSTMMYPLEAPNGWFLQSAHHVHELEGTHWVPKQMEEGAWRVVFKNTTAELRVVSGSGHTLEQAWAAALELANG